MKQISLVDLKKYYIRMYQEVRNYIWDFNTVQKLAELEIAVCRRFPNMPEVRSRFSEFYQCIRLTCSDDEYLSEAVNNFKNLINTRDEIYSRIIKPKEA